MSAPTKCSEAAPLPAGWQWRRLKFLARVQTGMAKGKDLAGTETTEVPYLRVANVQDGYLDLDDVATMAVPLADLPRYRLQPGDVLMNEGGDFDKLGRGHVWHGQIDPCIHQNHVFAVRPHGVSPDWLNAYTGSAPAQFYFMAHSKQSTNLASISCTNLMELPLPVPPEPVQRRLLALIAREADRIDALIEKKTRFIELLREKRQALITQAVTRGFAPGVPMLDSGVEWLGRVPAAWTLTRLRDLCNSISTGPFGSSLGNDDYIEDGVPVINPSHIGEDGFAPDPMISVSIDVAARLKYWQLQPGDVVVARRGELGRAAVVSTAGAGWICGTGSLIVRPNSARACPEMLYAILQAAYAREWLELHAVGATMANLNEAILGSLPVAVPPSIDEQIGVVARLNAAIAKLGKLQLACVRSIDLLRERRAALITAAVTGQIDVCAAVPDEQSEPA